MGERRIVHAQLRNQGTAGGATGAVEDDRLRRLVADRDRVAALLRASRRVELPSTTGAWPASDGGRPWALAETTEPHSASHLTLVDPGIDEDW